MNHIRISTSEFSSAHAGDLSLSLSLTVPLTNSSDVPCAQGSSPMPTDVSLSVSSEKIHVSCGKSFVTTVLTGVECFFSSIIMHCILLSPVLNKISVLRSFCSCIVFSEHASLCEHRCTSFVHFSIGNGSDHTVEIRLQSS